MSTATREDVKAEVLEVYADAWGVDECGHEWNDVVNRRSLEYVAGQPLSRGEAWDIMTEATPYGYNEYHPDDVFPHFPTDATFYLARELSVALYVKPGNKPLPSAQDVKADEYEDTPRKMAGCVRYWWD